MNEFKDSILKPTSIYLCSKGRNSGNCEDPSYNLGNTNLDGVKYAVVNSAEIPNVFPNIKTGINDTLSISDAKNNQAWVVTLSQGFYTLNDITTKLKTELDAGSGAGLVFTVTNDSKTAKMTIACTGPFRIVTAQSKMAPLLGITSDLGPGNSSTSITGEKGVNLIPTTCLYITSSTFGNNSYTWRGLTNIICKIPVNQFFGGVITYMTSDIKKDLMAINQPNLNDFQFKLYADDFSPIDMNGYDWSISVTLFR